MRTLVGLMGILSSEELDVLQNGGSKPPPYDVRADSAFSEEIPQM